MKTKSLTILLTIALLFMSVHVGAEDMMESTNESGMIKVQETPVYSAYSIQKQNGYIGLREWVASNYSSDSSASIFYLAETVEDVFMDDEKIALSFETWIHDHYARNTLVDEGDSLSLYTIVDPEFNPDIRSWIPSQDGSDDSNQNVRRSLRSSSCDSKYACNCVLWVRNCKASWLPTGMTYIWEKKSKINSDSPKKGRVAVMDIYYPYGHVAYVSKVDGSKIKIEEANYKKCAVSSRTDKPSKMKVVGYIK